MSNLHATTGPVSSSSLFQVTDETSPTSSANGSNGKGNLKMQPQLEYGSNAVKSFDDNSSRSAITFRNGSDEHVDSNAYKSVHVKFSKLTFREYPLLPSDNPFWTRSNSSVTEGPPVGLEWDHQSEYSIDIDQYESKKMPRRPSQLKIPSDLRTSMLMDFGHSRTTIHEATKQANHDRKLRGITMRRSDMSRIAFDEKVESFGRQFKIPFRKQRSKSTFIDTSHLRDSIDASLKVSKAARKKTMKVLPRNNDPLSESAPASLSKIELDRDVLNDSRDTEKSLDTKEKPLTVTKLKSKSFLCNSIETCE